VDIEPRMIVIAELPLAQACEHLARERFVQLD